VLARSWASSRPDRRSRFPAHALDGAGDQFVAAPEKIVEDVRARIAMRRRITCLAVCAPMRPKGTFSTALDHVVELGVGLASCASSTDSIWR
jgi:hypothetical protein